MFSTGFFKPRGLAREWRGRGVLQLPHSEISEHIRWLKALAADFTAMATEASKSVPQDAEEYALIAEAANYEISCI